MVSLSFGFPWGADRHSRGLVDALVKASAMAGADVDVAAEGSWPEGAGVPIVVGPPEPVAWTAPAAAAQSVLLCLQRPGTPSYESGIAASFASRVTTDRYTARRLRWLGHAVVDLPLGPWRDWAARAAPEREIDVLLLARYSDRRARILAGMARALVGRRSHLLLLDERDDAPRDLGSLLARSRLVLHIHDSSWPSFPWWLWLHAAANGAALVSERSSDADPVRPMLEFVSAGERSLGLVTTALLDNESWRVEMVRAAGRCVSSLPPLEQCVQALFGAAGGLPAATGRAAIQVPREQPSPSPLVVEPDRAAREEKRARLGELARRRAASKPSAPSIVADTRTVLVPRVSVIVALHDHERYIEDALESVGRSSWDDLELVVVDDASQDGSLDRARHWIEANDDLPSLLLANSVNRGLPATRNTALHHARGELVFVLDSDNAVYPSGIERLVEAIDGDPSAALAYGMLEMHDADAAVGLRSRTDWDPGRLQEGNPIDAMAVIRRSWLRRTGGYTDDIRLYGWEDYDLWCAIANDGGHGVFVPEIIGRYRVAGGSMLSLTDLSHADAYEALRERHPRVFAPVSSARAM